MAVVTGEPRRRWSPLGAAFLAAAAALGCAAGPQRQARPAPVVLADVRRPAGPASYLVICPQAAIETIMPLARWRRQHGQTVQIAPLEKIYAAYGQAGPSADAGRLQAAMHRRLETTLTPPAGRAILAFLEDFRRAPSQHGPQQQNQLRFLLLVGTADGANAEGLYLPTCIRRAQFYSEQMPCDRFLAGDSRYAAPSPSAAPDIAIGRLPARSLPQLRVMVAKTLAAEKAQLPGPWRRSADVFAGQGGYGKLVDAFLEQTFAAVMASEVPGYLDVHLSYANPSSPYCYAPSQFGRHIVERLNAGPALMVYIGHGSETGFDWFWWRQRRYDILSSSDVAALRVPDNRSLVISVACSTGRFDGRQSGIGEELLAWPSGPAAFIGSSRISQPYANAVLGMVLADAVLKSPPPTVGEALLKIQQWLAGDRKSSFRAMLDLAAATQLGFAALPAQRADQLTLYNLLGDPALPLGLVAEAASLEAPASVQPGQAVQVRMRAPLETGMAHFSLTIPRDKALGEVAPVGEDHPDAEAEMIRMNARANNKTLLAGQADIRAGRADWSFRLPRNLPPGPLYVNVYAQGSRRDAAGSRVLQVIPADPQPPERPSEPQRP